MTQSIDVAKATIAGKIHDSTAGSTAGTGISITGTFPKQTVTLSTPVSVANGGTGTATPGLVAGTNVTVTGSWPNQTIAATGGSSAPAAPQGRLTLTSGKPVMTADATAQTTIFYDSYAGNQVPVWSGSAMAGLTITSDEISLILDATHHLSGTLYDIFAISVAGVLTLVTGPAWTAGAVAGSTIARGTGAASTELQLKNGVWTNKNSITSAWNNSVDKGPVSANQGTYLGTFYATANGQTGMAFAPTGAAGGTNNILGLYNGYNRVGIRGICNDSTNSWTYATNTWRAANNSNSNRITFVDGLQQSSIVASYTATTTASANQAEVGIDLDSTTGAPAFTAAANTTPVAMLPARYSWAPQLGLHFGQGKELAANGTSVTFYGGARMTIQLEIQM